MKPEFAFASPSRTGWFVLLIVLMGVPISSAQAQALPSGRAGRGISLYESFDGSSSPSGSLLRMSNDVGYDLTRLMGMDINLPVYFTIPPVPQTGVAVPIVGLGNFAIDGHLSLDLPLVNYQPTVTIAFPTGSTSKGLSTGTVTYDVDNHFEHEFGLLAPFVDADVGNSLNNGNGPFRSKVQRPYMTLGKLAEFTAGARFHIIEHLTASADVYDVVPWGPQTVFSRIVMPGFVGTGGTHNRTFEVFSKTVGGAGIVQDNGFDASVEYSPTHFLDLTAGFNHSRNYDLNTLSLSVGINVSQLLNRRSE